MRVIIRREHYDVYDDRKVLVSHQGPAPHVLLFNGRHWQRIPVQAGAAEKIAARIRYALRKRQKSVDLNRTSGIPVSLPRIKFRIEEND